MQNLRKSSHNVLNRFTAKRIEGDTLVAKLGRAVSEAECLPRKEFFESWEMARRVRRQMRGGRIVEMAAGHGLLAAMMIILDDSSPQAHCIDINRPASQSRLLDALEHHWPRLRHRITYWQRPLEQFQVGPQDLLVSVHACGGLTDRVIDAAIRARSRIAVLPCCHDLKQNDLGGLSGWMNGPLAVDATRVARLTAAGFRCHTTTIPNEITPKNRLLLAWPEAVDRQSAITPS